MRSHRRPRTGRRVAAVQRAERPRPPEVVAVEALAEQLTRGAARGVRLWWVCVGFPSPEGFQVAAFAITTDPAGGIDAVGAHYAHRPLPSEATVLISSVQLELLDEDTLAAVLTLPRERFFTVGPADTPSAAALTAPDALRVQAALVADIARDER